MDGWARGEIEKIEQRVKNDERTMKGNTRGGKSLKKKDGGAGTYLASASL